MLRKRLLPLVAAAAALLAADGPAWKDKPVSEWTEEDAKTLLDDSPWVKTVHPTLQAPQNQQRQRRGMGRGGGIGIGLPGGIGFPGGRRGGMGYPGGGGVGGGRGGNNPNPEPPMLKVRWESAEPVREAELKARETNAPTLDEKHYAIAVYGVPNRMLAGDEKSLAGRLKKEAAIKRDGKKDFKPSSVEVLRREDGPVVVYLFPRSTEITSQDKRVEFSAKILRLEFAQSFFLEDMVYRGKVEL